MASHSRQNELREALENRLRVIEEGAEPPVPELIARVVLDARARRVPAYESQVNEHLRDRGQYHEVYTNATLIIGNCLEPADRDAPEIVPELEAKVAALDPSWQHRSG